MANPKLRFKADDGTDFPEWEYCCFDDVADGFNYGLGASAKEFDGLNTYIRITDIDDDSRLFKIDGRMSPSQLLEKGLVQKNDILMARTGSVGKTFIYSGGLDPLYFAGYLIRIRVKEAFCPKFIFYTTLSSKFIKWVSIESSRSVQPGLNAEQYRSYRFSCPCFEEQRKIADFLSTFDDKIEAKEQQLEALQETKKGLLQQIFSQQLRFKADDGTEFPEWECCDFDSCFEFISNKAFSREFLCDDDTPVKCIHYGDILIKYPTITDIKKVRVTSLKCPELANGVSRLKDGDVVFADTAEDYTAGKAIEIAGLSDNVEAIAGLHTFACRPKYLFATGYLGYFLNSSNYHKQIIPLLQGIKVYSINKKAIKGTKIFVPCQEEQRKIAEFLGAFDEKIEAVKRQLEALREIKKGLLQQMFV